MGKGPTQKPDNRSSVGPLHLATFNLGRSYTISPLADKSLLGPAEAEEKVEQLGVPG